MTQTQAKHTPGPWNCCTNSAHKPEFITADDKTVAAVFMDVAEWKENARLIAAAPELLAALKQAEEIVRACSNTGSHFAKEALIPIRAAIAKAEKEPT